MKISSELRKTISRARAAVETRDKIQAALDTAVSLQAGVEAQLQRCLEAVAEAEADLALGEVGGSSSAHGDLADAQANASVLAARIQGLQRRLNTHRAELQAASNELEMVRSDFNSGVMADYRKRLEAAAAEFSATLRAGAALADATGDQSMESAIRGISVRSPMSGELLIDLDVREVVGRERIPTSVWAGDAAATATYRAHAEAFKIASELRQAVQEAGASE